VSEQHAAPMVGGPAVADDAARATVRGRKRLLSIGHSYVVDVNRRLADALASAGDWEVTAAAPVRYRGDFGWHDLAPRADERCTVAPLRAHATRAVHLMVYGWRLRALLRERWDLVHCWEEPYVAAAAQVASWLPGSVPLVFATFQNIEKRYPPPFAWFERYVISRAAGAVAFGETVRDVLDCRGFKELPTRVIPPGVDTVRFAPDADAREQVREQLGWHDETPVVGFLGRLVPEKGVELLMTALDRLDRPWRALIVGSGILESRVREWSARHEGRVAIETSVPHGDVPRWLNAMDLLCAPSQTTPEWREQFGRMLIEAFACGIPVVSSDSGEMPHVVADAGVVVGEGDLDGWTRAIDRVLQDRAHRYDLAIRGRRRAVTIYDWDVVARQHLEFFDEILERRSVRAA
jgi:glycosyltransferase involved in cell wall biosynthesis